MTMAQVYEPPDKSLICTKCGLEGADANVGGWWIHSNCKPHVTALRAALDQERARQMSTYSESHTTDSNRAAVRYENADGATIALIYIDNAAGKRICRAFRDDLLRDGSRLLDKHTGAVVIGNLSEIAPVGSAA